MIECPPNFGIENGYFRDVHDKKKRAGASTSAGDEEETRKDTRDTERHEGATDASARPQH